MTLAQSRCHELTVTDIYIYIQTHGDSSTFKLGNKYQRNSIMVLKVLDIKNNLATGRRGQQ